MEKEKVERLDDTAKGTTMGDPDGPFRFIETLGVEVPTYIDPRPDLIAVNLKPGTLKYLDYHVPFQLRADYKPEQWPIEYYQKHRQSVRVNSEGYALCSGIAKATGKPCQSKAVNRSRWCRNHGGSLHPADKKLSIKTIGGKDGVPAERVHRLDRVQKFMQGFLSVEELDDDELTGNFVRTNAGNPVKGKALGIKFEQAMSKELHRRLNDYLKSKAPRMLQVMYEIADSDMVEPADRIKAAQWIAERVIGKTPDVLVNVSQEKPYEGILDNIQSGSREDYRQTIASSRPLEIVGSVDGEDGEDSSFMDVDEVEIEESEEALRNESDKSSGSGVSEGSDEFEGVDSSVLEKANEASDNREEGKNARDRLKKAKARRYAARATRGITIKDLPLLIEWRVIANVASSDFGKFRMNMILPDDVNETVLERIKKSNDPEVQAARIEASAAKLDARVSAEIADKAASRRVVQRAVG